MTDKKKTIPFFVTYILFLALLIYSVVFSTTKIDNRLLTGERVCISEDWEYEAVRSSGKLLPVRDFVKWYPMEREKVYVLKGRLPDDLTGAEALCFYSQNLELSVRVGDRIVYRLDAADGCRNTGAVENIVPLPGDAAGKEVTITYHSDSFFRYEAIDAVYLGEESGFVRGFFLERLPILAFAFICSGMAIVQLVSGFVLRGDKTHQMLYLGWVSLMYSIWMFGTSRILDFFSGYQLNGQNLRHSALALIAYPLFAYACLRFSVKECFWDKCLKWLAFLNFPIVLILRFAGIYWEESVLFTYLVLAAVFIRIFYGQAREWKRCRNSRREGQFDVLLSMMGIGLMMAGSAVDAVKYIFSLGEGRLLFSPVCFLIMSCILSYRSVEGALDMMRLGQNSESVKQMAYFDMLTQVYNRTALNEDMEKYERAKREKKNFGIVVFDVNNLKWVNDNLGHLAGDKLLQDSASIIRDGFEGYGKAYRFGGDEFVIVMEEGAKEKYSLGIQQMERLLAKHNEKVKKEEKISIAYGVAYYDGGSGQTLWQVHEAADNRMYERKRQMKARMNDGKDVRGAGR